MPVHYCHTDLLSEDVLECWSSIYVHIVDILFLQTAYYTAHSYKDKEGLDEDAILVSLNNETVVVHDYNKVNNMHIKE